MKATGRKGKEYDSWEDLLAEETNGFAVIVLLRERAPKRMLFPAVFGPFPTKEEADKAARRVRAKYRREDRAGAVSSDLVSVHVKPSWKEIN